MYKKLLEAMYIKLCTGFFLLSVTISTTFVSIAFFVKRVLYGVDLFNWLYIEIITTIVFYILFRSFFRKKFLGTYVSRSLTKNEKAKNDARGRQYAKLLSKEQLLKDFTTRYLIEGKGLLSTD